MQIKENVGDFKKTLDACTIHAPCFCHRDTRSLYGIWPPGALCPRIRGPASFGSGSPFSDIKSSIWMRRITRVASLHGVHAPSTVHQPTFPYRDSIRIIPLILCCDAQHSQQPANATATSSARHKHAGLPGANWTTRRGGHT